jgi:hypothetical protein
MPRTCGKKTPADSPDIVAMRKLFYCGLESYEARYTLQLTEWNRRVFDRRGLDVVYVPGTTIDNTQTISVGQVLDAHGRSFFSMSQMMNLVQMMRNGEVTNEDVIYFEDMFQPGIESLILTTLFMYGVWLSGWVYMRRWLMNLPLVY